MMAMIPSAPLRRTVMQSSSITSSVFVRWQHNKGHKEEEVFTPPDPVWPNNTTNYQQADKHFRKSRWRNYDFDTKGDNTNKFVHEKPPRERFATWRNYPLTTLKGKNATPLQRNQAVMKDAEAFLESNTKPEKGWFSNAINSVFNKEQAQGLFEIAQKTGSVDNELIAKYIYKLAKIKAGAFALSEWSRLSSEHKLDNDINTSLIFANFCEGKEKPAFEIIEGMKKHGISLTPRIHAGTLTYYFDNGFMRKGIQYFEDLVKNGWAPDAAMYTAMIKGYRMIGDMKNAEEIYNQMIKKGVKPSFHTHQQLVLAWGRAGKDLTQMMQSVQRMKDAGFKPDSTLYNNIMTYMMDAGELHNARVILDTMVKEQALPIDKLCVRKIAVYFANFEKADREKPITKSIIETAHKGGYDVSDLQYLLTPHYGLMPDHYFRHHAGYDFPFRKEYQFREKEPLLKYDPPYIKSQPDPYPYSPKSS